MSSIDEEEICLGRRHVATIHKKPNATQKEPLERSSSVIKMSSTPKKRKLNQMTPQQMEQEEPPILDPDNGVVSLSKTQSIKKPKNLEMQEPSQQEQREFDNGLQTTISELEHSNDALRRQVSDLHSKNKDLEKQLISEQSAGKVRMTNLLLQIQDIREVNDTIRIELEAAQFTRDETMPLLKEYMTRYGPNPHPTVKDLRGFKDLSHAELCKISQNSANLTACLMHVMSENSQTNERRLQNATLEHREQMAEMVAFTNERAPGTVICCSMCYSDMPITSKNLSSETDWPFICQCYHEPDRRMCLQCLEKLILPHNGKDSDDIVCPFDRSPFKHTHARRAKRESAFLSRIVFVPD